MKRCPHCALDLPLSAFHVNRSGPKVGQPQSWCAGCKNQGRRKGGQHPRQQAESVDDRYHKIRGKYGLSRADHELMERAQGGLCAICNQAPTRGRKRLDVDHDHRSGKVRGLLCSHCNRAIGLLGDDSMRLRTAARYLEDVK